MERPFGFRDSETFGAALPAKVLVRRPTSSGHAPRAEMVAMRTAGIFRTGPQGDVTTNAVTKQVEESLAKELIFDVLCGLRTNA
jgi:hypothetical protein